MADPEDGTWRYQWPAGSRFLLEIADLVQVQGRRVIDLGCGQGRLGRWALEHGAAEVVFADLSPVALAAIPAHPRARLLEHRWGEPLQRLRASLTHGLNRQQMCRIRWIC